MIAVNTLSEASSNSKNWLVDKLSILTSAGWRVTPVYEGNKTLHYCDNKSTTYNNASDYDSAIYIGLILDNTILVNININELEAVSLEDIEAIFEVKDINKHIIHSNKHENTCSLLFKLPSGIDKAKLRQVNKEKWLNGVEIQTGNQLMYIAPDFVLQNNRFPKITELSVAPQQLVDALRVEKTISKTENFEFDRLCSFESLTDSKKAQLNEILYSIDHDCSFDDWLKIATGIGYSFGVNQATFELFDTWSKGKSGYNAKECLKVYYSFKRTSRVVSTFATVSDLAEKNGANLSAISRKFKTIERIRNYPSFDSAIEALRRNRDNEIAFYDAVIHISAASDFKKTSMIKQIVSLSDVDTGTVRTVIKQLNKEVASEPMTHHDMAAGFIDSFEEQPVGCSGSIWFYNDTTGVWNQEKLEYAGSVIAQKYNKEQRCARGSDYKAIASHIYDMVNDEVFFNNSTKGINTPDGFYTVKTGKVILAELSKEHRVRFQINVSPDFNSTPELFFKVLNDAFGEETAEQQIRMLQQHFGLALLGMQSSVQRAVFLYGAAGSGKSLILKILGALVPAEYRCNVSPLEVDQDYKAAALAGKLLNLVAEIDRDKPVPSAKFKNITGDEEIMAREPYGKAFKFKSSAGNWFNGNSYLTTRDHTEGFWRRWSIIRFFNGKKAHERDPSLEDRIIKNELPAILAWAIMGVRDYLSNGLFESDTHFSCLEEWKNTGNSVKSWLSEEDGSSYIKPRETGEAPLSRKLAYQLYKTWCHENSRKPFQKGQFQATMEEAGHTATKNSGLFGYKTLTQVIPN